MKTVFIVGAGGSLSQASSIRPKKALRHPPLDSDFFAKVARLADVDPDLSKLTASFRRSLKSLATYPDPFDTHGPALEQFFADVYYEVASGEEESMHLFVDLLRLYSAVIGETTNWLAGARLGILDRILRRELTVASNELTVITFNQDLVLENVAARLPYIKGKWCLRGLYGDPSLPELGSDDGNLFTQHESGCAHKSPFLLLKLHGSLNWLLRTRDRRPKQSALFPKQDKRVYLAHEREVLLDGRITTPTRSGRSTWYTWPLVVPPIYEKTHITGMNVLKRVWTLARTAITEADRVVLFGYSLPDADVGAAQMLRRAFSANTALEQVECVNPDANVAAKLKDRLDCKVLKLYHSLETFLDYGGPQTDEDSQAMLPV